MQSEHLFYDFTHLCALICNLTTCTNFLNKLIYHKRKEINNPFIKYIYFFSIILENSYAWYLLNNFCFS